MLSKYLQRLPRFSGFSNLKLAQKFTLLLSLVFVGAILLSGLALSKALEHKAEKEIQDRAQVLMTMVNSVRDYNSDRITPIVELVQADREDFLPEAIPSFAVRESFEKFRQNREYRDFFYKDAALNPTNLRDKADDFEKALIMRFREKPNLKSISGYREMVGQKIFYTALPFKITNPACLVCHSTPEAAPKSMIESYGDKNGFGWPLNKVLVAQIIYVPGKEIFSNARQAFNLFIGIFIAIFALTIFFINNLLKREVIKPIRPMAQIAQKVSTDTLTEEDTRDVDMTRLGTVARRTDELGQLGLIFENMVREVYAREKRLKQQLTQLLVQIDETKRAREVSEIAGSDYFQKLQKEAKDIRKKWSETGNKE
ncbi:MAG: c-type heme family protein [Xenococcaceae cyanobacterium]